MTGSLLFVTIILAGMLFSIMQKKLTASAALTGGVLAALIYFGGGYPGLLMLTAFFISGSVATAVRKEKKEELGLAEKDHGRRKTSQVLANAGMPAFFGLLSILFPAERQLFQLMMASCLAAAASDTLSSELGNVFGKSFYNILSLKPDKRGLDGVVSLEGTLFGLIGSLLISSVNLVAYEDWTSFTVIFIAGFTGNLADSCLGASLQRKSFLNNDFVNFLNAVIAALVALLGGFLI